MVTSFRGIFYVLEVGNVDNGPEGWWDIVLQMHPTGISGHLGSSKTLCCIIAYLPWSDEVQNVAMCQRQVLGILIY